MSIFFPKMDITTLFSMTKNLGIQKITCWWPLLRALHDSEFPPYSCGPPFALKGEVWKNNFFKNLWKCCLYGKKMWRIQLWSFSAFLKKETIDLIFSTGASLPPVAPVVPMVLRLKIVHHLSTTASLCLPHFFTIQAAFLRVFEKIMFFGPQFSNRDREHGALNRRSARAARWGPVRFCIYRF